MKFDLVRFGDYLSLEKGASYTSANLAKESDIGLLTINAFKVGGGYKQNSEKPFVGEVKQQFSLEEGDVLVAMTEQDAGLLASPLVVKIDQTNFDSLLYSLDVAKVMSINNQIDPRFVFNVLRIPAFRIRAAYGDTGSTVQRLPYEALSDLKIPKPPLQVQKAIIALMDSLDEKIRVNQQIAANLEAISQSLFKSWFVDYDPVKAKMSGERPLGMDESTASLFPDSLQDSELGLIPEGWQVSGLDQVSNVRYGAPFASKYFNTSGLGQPLIRIRDLRKQVIATWTPEKHAKGFLVSGGELLVGMDGEFNPTLWFGEDALVNQRICMIERKSFVSNFFLYFTLLPIMRRIEHGSTGSTVIHLGKSDIDSIKLVVPTENILQKYQDLTENFLSQIVAINKQNRTLSQVRDLLLPRLVSGELKVPDEMLVP